MTERHGGRPSLRSLPATTGHMATTAAGERVHRIGWKTARNGMPPARAYEWQGYPDDGDPERDAEAAAELAEIRAEAVRNVLAPGETGERMNRDGFWVPCRREAGQ